MAIVTPFIDWMFYQDGPGKFLFGDITSVTANEVVVYSSSYGSTSFNGQYTGNFHATPSGDIAGRVTGFTFSYLGTDRIEVKNLDLDAARFFNLIGTDDQNGLWRFMFSGNDVFDLRSMKIYGGYSERLDVLSGNDTVYGSNDHDWIRGGSGLDTLYGSLGHDTLQGEAGRDTLFGDAGNDIIAGNAGRDSIYGGWDDDQIAGGAASDMVEGGLGNDRLIGGKGADQLAGGLGADLFTFRLAGDSGVSTLERDTITDFSAAEGDRIALSAMDSNSRMDGNQSFSFIGTDRFGNSAGELRFVSTATGSVVLGDINGDGRADFSIDVDRVGSFTEEGFLL